MTESSTEAPLKGVSLKVVSYLHEGIRSGSLAPGQRLVEADLARDLSVGRGAVREAFSRLAAEGLIEIVPHRGASVRKMSEEDVAELFAAREILEGGAARLAAENIESSPLRAVLAKELAKQQEWTNAADLPGYVEANERVHTLLVEAAGNRILSGMIGQLQINTWRTLSRDLLSLSRVRESSRQHVNILTAVLQGSATAAEQLMREHILSTQSHQKNG